VLVVVVVGQLPLAFGVEPSGHICDDGGERALEGGGGGGGCSAPADGGGGGMGIVGVAST